MRNAAHQQMDEPRGRQQTSSPASRRRGARDRSHARCRPSAASGVRGSGSGRTTSRSTSPCSRAGRARRDVRCSHRRDRTTRRNAIAAADQHDEAAPSRIQPACARRRHPPRRGRPSAPRARRRCSDWMSRSARIDSRLTITVTTSSATATFARPRRVRNPVDEGMVAVSTGTHRNLTCRTSTWTIRRQTGTPTGVQPRPSFTC